MIAFPSARSEAWRWSDLSALPEIATREPSGRIPDALPWIDCDRPGPRLLFVDGQLAGDLSDPGPVELATLSVEAHDHPLARLAGQQGWRLRLGRDHAPTGLVQIIHVATGAADHLAAEIELDVGAQASIVETFIGDGWTNRLTSIRLFAQSRLMLHRRLLGSSGMATITDRGAVGEGASLVCAMVAAGAGDSRIDGRIDLAGAHAYAEYSAALLARGRQRHDANLVVRHDLPHGLSKQVWRSVADDRAACSVAARVEVARGAQKTDAEQSLKGLLLSRTATINAKPELEIFADDVKCAHGSTVGQLDRDALFYLESRGLPPAEARSLLTRIFVADAFDRVGEEQVRETLYDDASRWFG